MLARHLHLLSAFAGGCVTTVVLVVVVLRAGGGAPPGPAERAPAPREDEVVLTPADATSSAPDVAPLPEPTPAKAAQQYATPPAPHDDGEAAERGDSVADVLARLEAGYRERMSAVERPTPPLTDDTTSDAATAEPTAPPRASAALAAAAPPPAAAAPPAAAGPEPISVLAAAADAQKREDRARELERELYLASLYRAEEYQQRQLVVLQYLELLAQSRSGTPVPSPRAPRNVTARRSPSFSFPLTNPDNPWGFDLPPTVLAK
jgi:hypothetical protein